MTVAVVGGETVEATVGSDATYADLLAAVDLSPHEATVLVDGRPAPEDAPVETDAVRVLRLVRGGTDGAGERGDGVPAVRTATPADGVAVLRVLDGALLDVDPDRVRERIDADEALVAARDGHAVGALVRDGDEVLAVAVRRRWRGRGVGRALVERALGTAGRLTAEFDPRVRGFYESLGFEVAPVGGDAADRLRGVRTG